MLPIVELAISFIGINEAKGTHKQIIDIYNSHKPLARGYKMKYTDAWCATFISALAIKCNLTNIIPTECGCERQIELFKKLGEWVENDAYVPHEGDIIYYDWQDSGKGDNTGWSDHVGIVEKCDGKNITVIEGNYKDAVGRRTIAVNARYIRGFAVPKYPSTPAKTPQTTVQQPKPASTPASNKPTATTTTTSKKSVEEVAKEVLNGKWSNGAERKKKLEAAGYVYTEVQTYVNLMVNKTTLDKVARDVINGKYGNGSERKTKLTRAGYDYNVIQKRVNELFK